MKKICSMIMVVGLFSSVLLFLVPWTSAASIISYTYDDAGRLVKADYKEGKSITYTYDANGNLLQVKVSESEQAKLDMIKGWNLLSLTAEPVSNNVDVLLTGISNNIESVWKWETAGWAVLLPGEDTPGAYASSKGFAELASLSPGEGFWINAKQADELNLEGSPLSGGSLSLTSGWNLKGLLQDSAATVSDLLAENQQSITSIWKWAGGGWAVYLPGDPDGGAAYAGNKGFELLENIELGEGFWVNAE